MTDSNTAGLAGVSAGETSISTVGKSGVGLSYRGYKIEDLASKASFEEVAYLLINGELPTLSQLTKFQTKLRKLRDLPQALKIILQQIPKQAHPMDVLRTGCSALGTLEPEKLDNDAHDCLIRLIACFPSIMMYWYHYHFNNQETVLQTQEESFAGHLLHLLHGAAPSKLDENCINASLILYAEHEFNASTFAARVTTATLSDVYSAVTSAIGTLRGSLHGGANEAAMELIEQFNSPQQAEEGLREMLANKQKIMGFGHRVYKTSDPRSDIIKEWAKKLSTECNDTTLFSISEMIEKVMWDEKALFPNLDFYSASAYRLCKIPTSLFTPMFVFSRITGWGAHILEQRENNRLIRPTADYIGPKLREFPSLESR